ncbi:MAG: hypothetical protein ACK521_06795 [bacterium]|jgi:hypothetical protein
MYLSQARPISNKQNSQLNASSMSNLVIASQKHLNQDRDAIVTNPNIKIQAQSKRKDKARLIQMQQHQTSFAQISS